MATEKSLVMHFMSTPLRSVRDDFVLEQAEKVFHDYSLSAVPVMVDVKRVMGVLTDFKLLKFFLLRNSKPARARLRDFEAELDPVVLVDQNAPIETAFRMLVQSPSHRLFVTDHERVVGALSPRDMLPYLAGDAAMERAIEDKDLIAARVRIKALMNELGRTKADRDQYEQAFNASPYMMHSVDLSGVIRMANPMLHWVLGYEDGQLIGRSVLDIYPQQFHTQVIAGLDIVKTTGYHPLLNTLMVRKNQELIQVDIATGAKHSANGEIIATITVSRISDAAKMADALEHAIEHQGTPHAGPTEPKS